MHDGKQTRLISTVADVKIQVCATHRWTRFLLALRAGCSAPVSRRLYAEALAAVTEGVSPAAR